MTSGPLELPGPVVALHPFETPEGREHTWQELAVHACIDLKHMLALGSVNPRPLRALRPPTLGELNLPHQGMAPISVRTAVAGVLTAGLTQHVTLGLYGGGGEPEEIESSVGPVEVAGLDYWFGCVGGAEFLTAWATGDRLARHWSDSLTFAWPDDHSWFLHVDPEAFHTDLYARAELLDRLTSTRLETYRPQG